MQPASTFLCWPRVCSDIFCPSCLHLPSRLPGHSVFKGLHQNTASDCIMQSVNSLWTLHNMTSAFRWELFFFLLRKSPLEIFLSFMHIINSNSWLRSWHGWQADMSSSLSNSCCRRSKWRDSVDPSYVPYSHPPFLQVSALELVRTSSYLWASPKEKLETTSMPVKAALDFL